jgi:hypothetical protein
MGYLSNINRLSAADNIGGILDIQVARKVEVALVKDPVAGVVYGPITMVGAAGFVTWQVTGETPGTNSTGRAGNQGTSKGNRLKFSIPKDRASLRAMFEQASEDEFVVLYRDANGQQKIFGSPASPVQFRFNHSSGDTPGSKNGYECEFYFDGPENMFEYNGAITSAPAGPAPAIVNFNGAAIASLAPGETLNITSEYSLEEYFTIAP